MSIAYRISAYNRNRKWQLFLRTMKPRKNDLILDVGYTDKEYSDTDNFLEKHYSYLKNITALSTERPKEFPERYPEVKVVWYKGGKFPFKDDAFSVCWSNAVIEHVGDRDRQIAFLREIKRVSKRAFLTTPNRRFPVEVHTRTPLLHFLPQRFFYAYLRMIGKGWAADNYMWLLSLGDIKSMLREAGIAEYTIIKNRFFGFTLDYVIVF